MTSKEAFKELRKFLQEKHNEMFIKPIKLETFKGFNLDKIEQDLDRLEKLEKAIKSLKDNIYFTFNDECTYICFQRDVDDECDYTIIFPNKEQYELLKEVLEND